MLRSFSFALLLLITPTLAFAQIGRNQKIFAGAGASSVDPTGAISTDLTFNDTSGGTRKINAQASPATDVAGTSITIQPGTGGATAGSTAGGALTLNGGTGGNTTGTGGNVSISGGAGGTCSPTPCTAGNSGGVTLDAGAVTAGATATAGTITIGGTNASGLTIGRTGVTTTNTGALTSTGAFTASGSATFSSGIGSISGDVTFAAGATRKISIATQTGTGNQLTIAAPNGTSNGIGGLLNLIAGDGQGTGQGGAVQITSGAGSPTGNITVNAGSGGTLTLDTGATVSIGGSATTINVSSSGKATNVLGTLAITGATTLTGGVSGGISPLGGDVTFTANAGGVRTVSITATGSGAGTGLTLTPGAGTGTNTGGALTLNSAGSGAGGTAGNITMDTASATTLGTISIGATNSGAITIGRTGQSVSCPGTLSVTGATTLGTTTLGTTTIGASGAAISGSFRTTGSVDLAPIAANSCGEITTTLTGAIIGAECIVGLPASPTANLTFQCYVSATDNATLRTCNPTTASIDPPLATYSMRVFNP